MERMVLHEWKGVVPRLEMGLLGGVVEGERVQGPECLDQSLLHRKGC